MVVVVVLSVGVLAVADVSFFPFGWLMTVLQSWWRLRNLDGLSNLKHSPLQNLAPKFPTKGLIGDPWLFTNRLLAHAGG